MDNNSRIGNLVVAGQKKGGYAAQPAKVSAAVAAERLMICVDCQYYASGTCRLFGCCGKSLAEKVTWALAQCPARPPKWGMVIAVHKPLAD